MTPFINIPQSPSKKEKRHVQDEDDFDSDSDDSIIDRLEEEEVILTKNLLDPNTLRSATVSPSLFSQQNGRGLSPHYHPRGISPAASSHSYRAPLPAASQNQINPLHRFWVKYRPMILVASSQFFGALMNLAARILEFDNDNPDNTGTGTSTGTGKGMHPFQILFARMSITTICSCIYMYYTRVPNFPFGAKDVRWLLVIRGLTGFFGIFPLWLSLMYLPLAEATVISFLAPGVAGWICHLVSIGTPFTKREQVASFVALLGVVLIARPTSLFQTGGGEGGGDTTDTLLLPGNSTAPVVAHRHSVEDATPAERLTGIGIGLVGVLGAAGAFSAIRCIGTRAHPLISVNYFSTWCTIVSSTALLVAPILDIGQPEIRFGLPSSGYQWFLLISLGVCGFVMQFMLTSGLGKEKQSNANGANAMVYTHMIWAAGFDRFVFGHRMGGWSLLGCGLVIGGALWVALSRKEGGGELKRERERDGEGNGDVEMGEAVAARRTSREGGGVESVPMLRADLEDDDTDQEEEVDDRGREEARGGIPLRARVE